MNNSSKTSSKIPLPEYPRPQLVRENFEILNGEWDYAVIAADPAAREAETIPDPPVSELKEDFWQGVILVPYSPEAPLSGVGRVLKPGERLYYRRRFDAVPHEEGWHLLIHFGAVDQTCTVYINGQKAGGHAGGYLPFTIDATPFLSGTDEELIVAVEDVTDTSYHARGKQKLEPGGMFYTPQSGIWKTVWMEWVPPVYITDVRMTPLYDDSMIVVNVAVSDGSRISATAQIEDDEQNLNDILFHTGDRIYVHIPDFHSWSPEDPHLYTIRIQTDDDSVQSYFAMRKFSREKDAHGIPRFMLNGRPYFCSGVLDQGYWPGGLMTPPDDRAMQRDIREMKRLGFNTLRKHVKIESDRWYYHCDKIGMLVWQDMPNGGGTYDMNALCNIPTIFQGSQRMVRDNRYAMFSRQDRAGREEYMDELEEMIHHLYSTACICTWVPFNEGWGQFDALDVTERIRRLDRTRLIDHASGWFDQKGGDYYSIHNYFRKLSVKPGRRIVALTEYGGYSLLIPGHAAGNGMPAYRAYESQARITRAWNRLIQRDILPNIARGLSAAFYTQLSDIEQEINGIVTYDREVMKIDPSVIKRMNRKIQRVFRDCTSESK